MNNIEIIPSQEVVLVSPNIKQHIITTVPLIEKKNQKLPKQWQDWVKKAGLRPHHAKNDKWHWSDHSWFYLRGRNHVWRINMYGHFQCGDTPEDFDRWSRCDIVFVDKVPSTRDEFIKTVKELAALHNKLREEGFFEAEETECYNVLLGV